MALTFCKKVFSHLRSPLIEVKRYRGKINLRKPQKPHFERALFLTLAKPKFESKLKQKTLPELCSLNRTNREQPDNPYERIIASEILENFETSKTIMFYHRCPMKIEDVQEVTRQLRKNDSSLEIYGKNVMKIALEGTRYESVLPFYFSHNAIVFSGDHNVKKVVQICRKYPQLVLLAGILEGKFVSRDELMQYSTIPNLQTGQANLVHTLMNIGGRIVNQVNTPQSILVSHLQQRVKQLDEKQR